MAEEIALKATQCGFESHRGHMSNHEQSQDHQDPSGFYSQATWDARYSESTRVWSGEPNRRLVEQIEGRPAGRALDIGCGEGADAVWLARQGWSVTALDVSEVALERTRQHAEEAGLGEQVETVHVDLMAEESIPGTHDLVSAFFMHVPEDVFVGFHQRLGEAVAPGGLLLVVGHHPDDLHSGVRRPHGPAMLFTPEQVVAALDPAEWMVVVADAQAREQQGPDGPVAVRDSVALLQRR